MDAEAKQALLEQYNPVLVMFPESDLATRRPGAWWKWPTRRGDYYPCPVEVFLSLIVQRDRPRPWKLFHWNPDAPWLLFKAPPPEALTKIADLEQKLSKTAPAEIAQWELDISPFKSADSSQTWDVFQIIYASNKECQRHVTYARCIEVGTDIVLQYWYFYLYNDAPNKHEGDWEMVSLKLDATTSPPQPRRAGYSSHDDGYRRQWPEMEFAPDGRPYVYIGRGSHAAYFQPCIVQTQKFDFSKGLSGLFGDVMGVWDFFTSRLPGGGIRDHTAKLPTDNRSGFDVGQPVEMTVRPMPETVADAWWRAIDCPWGSSHAKIDGFTAPPPPWKQTKKWHSPVEWIDCLPPDPLAGKPS